MTFHPTAADPAIVTASDATLFACWLEQIHDGWRWMFMSTAKMHYVGPPYNGEDSLEQLRDLVAVWWSGSAGESQSPRVDQSLPSPPSRVL